MTELVSCEGIRLVHVWNPWGMREWEGPWCDGSPEWAKYPAVAAACKYTGPVDDGCFWIQLEDLCLAFNVLYSCRLLDASQGWFLERREVRVRGSEGDRLGLLLSVGQYSSCIHGDVVLCKLFVSAPHRCGYQGFTSDNAALLCRGCALCRANGRPPQLVAAPITPRG